MTDTTGLHPSEILYPSETLLPNDGAPLAEQTVAVRGFDDSTEFSRPTVKVSGKRPRRTN